MSGDMAEFLFSIPPEHLPRGAARAVGAALAPTPVGLTGQWRTAEGVDVGPPIVIAPPAATHLEFPDLAGRMVRSDVASPAAFRSDVAPAATHLRLSRAGVVVGDIPRAALLQAPAALPAPVVARFGPAEAAFAVPVFSERFADQAGFMAHVQSLHDWVVTQPPFDDPAVAARLAFDAHFWASDPVNGLFQTDDSKCQPGGRLFYGDRALAQQLLAPCV